MNEQNKLMLHIQVCSRNKSAIAFKVFLPLNWKTCFWFIFYFKTTLHGIER